MPIPQDIRAPVHKLHLEASVLLCVVIRYFVDGPSFNNVIQSVRIESPMSYILTGVNTHWRNPAHGFCSIPIVNIHYDIEANIIVHGLKSCEFEQQSKDWHNY